MSGLSDLVRIRAFGDALTTAQLRVLRRMARDRDDDACELVREDAVAYLDLDRVPVKTVDALLRACAISDSGFAGPVERYRINSTGRDILRRKYGKEGTYGDCACATGRCGCARLRPRPVEEPPCT